MTLPPITGRRIDWSQIVFDLERAGLSQWEITKACDGGDKGVWANRLKNIPGTQPKFHQGALLLGLWALKTGKEVAEAPVAA